MKKKDNWSIEHTSPEFRLMLLCSGRILSESQVAEARGILTSGIDWRAFTALLDKHRMIPVVFDNLKTSFPEIVDQPGMRELGVLRMKSMKRSMRIASAWVSLNAAMRAADVRVLHLKGPALTLRLYGNIDSRISKDLDLLIDIADVEKADRVLRQAGYTRKIPAADLTPKQMELWIRNNHHFSYWGPNVLIVELHFRLSSFLDVIPFDELWAKRRTGVYGESEYSCFSPEEELLFCAYHGAKHAWVRLRWLTDVDELICIGDYDIALLKTLAEERRMAGFLSQAVVLCEKLFRSGIPVDLRETVGNDRFGRRLAKMAFPLILAPEDVIRTNAYRKYGFCLAEGWTKKMRFVARHFQPREDDFRSVSLSDRAFWLYYPVRILNWVKRKLSGIKEKMTAEPEVNER